MEEEAHNESFIIEFTAIGGGVKVTAIDPATGREVSIVGASGATRHDLGLLAVRKLKYVLEKEEKESEE